MRDFQPQLRRKIARGCRTWVCEKYAPADPRLQRTLENIQISNNRPKKITEHMLKSDVQIGPGHVIQRALSTYDNTEGQLVDL